MIPEINKHYFLNVNSITTIPQFSEVVVDNIINYPASDKQFVTLRDAKRMTGKYNTDPIVATVLLTDNLLIENLPENLHLIDKAPINPHTVLVKRYIQLIKTSCPGIEAMKDTEGSLHLTHALWMLEKMDKPDYVPLTSREHWLGWIQAALFLRNLINVQHEKDITRDVCKTIPSIYLY